MGNARATVSIPADLLAAADRQAKERRLNRSEFVEAALRAYLERLDEDELEGRLGIGQKVENLAELVGGRSDEIAGLTAKLSNQERALTIKALQAAERVYALLEAQFGHNIRISFEEAQEVARRRAQESLRPGGVVPSEGETVRDGSEGGKP